MGNVVTVSGSIGGIGTSTFAYALALQAQGSGKPSREVVLVDAQTDGAPLDLVIGAEAAAGIRWSQVRIQSRDITAETIRSALPDYRGVRILAADAQSTFDPVALEMIVGVLRSIDGVTIIDIGSREPLRETLQPDLEILLMTPTLCGIVAAERVLLARTHLVLVDTGRADVPNDRVAAYMGRPVAGVVRWQSGITAAARSGGSLPAGCDLMRVAKAMLEVGSDGI